MLLFNNKTPKKINFNGKHVAKVIFNNVVVWLEKVLTIITGYPITLTNSTGDNLVDYKIYGNSVQDGTPTPDNPIEIQSVGDLVTDESDANYGKYKIPVKLSGKNLLPNSNWMSGVHSTGFVEKVGIEYITEYTQNSISFNLPIWSGVSSPRFPKKVLRELCLR